MNTIYTITLVLESDFKTIERKKFFQILVGCISWEVILMPLMTASHWHCDSSGVTRGEYARHPPLWQWHTDYFFSSSSTSVASASHLPLGIKTEFSWIAHPMLSSPQTRPCAVWSFRVQGTPIGLVWAHRSRNTEKWDSRGDRKLWPTSLFFLESFTSFGPATSVLGIRIVYSEGPCLFYSLHHNSSLRRWLVIKVKQDDEVPGPQHELCSISSVID